MRRPQVLSGALPEAVDVRASGANALAHPSRVVQCRLSGGGDSRQLAQRRPLGARAPGKSTKSREHPCPGRFVWTLSRVKYAKRCATPRGSHPSPAVAAHPVRSLRCNFAIASVARGDTRSSSIVSRRAAGARQAALSARRVAVGVAFLRTDVRASPAADQATGRALPTRRFASCAAVVAGTTREADESDQSERDSHSFHDRPPLPPQRVFDGAADE
jgi:hypothetical protein